ncbi:hypothetical protein SAMN05421877_101401 [Sphingobacterium lactis]|uniref:Uncharacterized protein n=1 Tax=Sphingobacterium lactis TaxID=797291 RepID=A0A1H5SY21_9SPHI|nr:hypothetical protein SAMN05421877_101401 [Sphingobacterium lactis]
MEFIFKKEYYKPNKEEVVTERFVQIRPIKSVSCEFEGNINLRNLRIGNV